MFIHLYVCIYMRTRMYLYIIRLSVLYYVSDCRAGHAHGGHGRAEDDDGTGRAPPVLSY